MTNKCNFSECGEEGKADGPKRARKERRKRKTDWEREEKKERAREEREREKKAGGRQTERERHRERVVRPGQLPFVTSQCPTLEPSMTIP